MVKKWNSLQLLKHVFRVFLVHLAWAGNKDVFAVEGGEEGKSWQSSVIKPNLSQTNWTHCLRQSAYIFTRSLHMYTHMHTCIHTHTHLPPPTLACPPGQFQPYLSNSTNPQMCLSCPANSTSTQPASSVCSCDFGLSRNNDRLEDPCTSK